MPVFIEIPDIDPKDYSLRIIAFTAAKTLQIIDRSDNSSSCPIPRSETAWQIDRNGCMFVIQNSIGFQLFDEKTQENRANLIVEVVSETLIAVKSKVTKGQLHQNIQLLKYCCGINDINWIKIARSNAKSKHGKYSQ